MKYSNLNLSSAVHNTMEFSNVSIGVVGAKVIASKVLGVSDS